MKDLFLKPFRSNSELSNYMRTTAHLQTVKSRREAVNVAVIDDEAFAPQTNLQSYGYRITPIGDMKDLAEVAGYHMVLCDIMGVGRHFDMATQGASLISEIKKNYPEKIVIAYTGAMLNEKASKIAQQRADAIIKKGIDIEDWITKLDHFSEAAVDPHVIWNKVRTRLIEIDVSTKDVMLLEDAYVRSVFRRDPMLSHLKSRSERMNIGSDVRAIIQGLASSAIFSAIVGHS
ncbi:hypothetical protein NFI95_10660 [Acetobacteraceae bacterium KSS8]|uniref:Response regulator n=1 Tax=Endosaccharibacter trunci TaxID=2812733 RepID=A0ABT1W7P6_9PROT|nr:hypothetical protein [Acetobacteraceae bacterium KSS8]